MIYLLLTLGSVVAFIWAWVVFPSFRTVTVILALIIGGSIFAWKKHVEEEDKQYAIEKEQERIACEAQKKVFDETEKRNWAIVLPSEVEIRDFVLTPPAYGDAYSVTASVKNRSAVNISKLKINVVAFDCPIGASNFNQCDTVGHDEKDFYSDIPKGEVRQIKGNVTLPNVPRPRGKFSWSFRVVGVKASTGSVDDDLLAKWVRCGP
jgi:hypothetical protein